MAEHHQLPVIASVRAAFAFFMAHWMRFAPAAGLAGLGGVVLTQAIARDNAAVALLGVAVWGVIAVAYRAALLRFALNGEYSGLFGMRLGGDEARLGAVSVLTILFLALVCAAASTPVMIVVMGVTFATGDPATMQAASAAGDSAAAMAAMGPVAGAVLRAGLTAVVCLVLFVYVRLCLAEPATIGERRIVFLKSWPWTKGEFWRLLAATVLAALPGLAVANFLGILAAMLTAQGAAPAGLVVSFAGAFAGSLVGGMMSAGLLVFLYRGLRPALPPAASSAA